MSTSEDSSSRRDILVQGSKVAGVVGIAALRGTMGFSKKIGWQEPTDDESARFPDARANHVRRERHLRRSRHNPQVMERFAR